MKEDEYTKRIAKNQVCAIFHMRDIRKNDGDAMLVSLGTPLWSPETNRNICFWVFPLMGEFYAWGTHKDLSNIYSWDKECLDSKIAQNRLCF